MTSTSVLKIMRISIEIKIKSYPLYSTLLNFLISQNKEYGFNQLHEFWQWTKFIIGKSLANFAKRHLENWTLQQANCVQIHFESFPFLRYEPTKWGIYWYDRLKLGRYPTLLWLIKDSHWFRLVPMIIAMV